MSEAFDKTAYMKVYQQTPKQVEYQAKYMATYWQNRKNKDKHNKRRKDRYANDSDYRKKQLEMQNTPERKALRKKYDAERYAKKKAETQGEGNLDLFLK